MAPERSVRTISDWFSGRPALVCVAAVTTVFLLSLGIGCSDTKLTSPSSPSQQGSPTGFTNANLKGNYTYSLGGYSVSNNEAYLRAGTFLADGNGNIASGSDDFVQAGVLTTTMTSGSYAIASDGTGILMINLSGGSQIQLALTIGSSGKVLLIAFDSTESGAGQAFQQSSSAISTAPAGTYVFRTHSYEPNVASSASISSVGSITSVGLAVTGFRDVVRFGTFASVTLTGTLTAPDPDGRGTLTLTDNTAFPSSFVYYVIDSGTLSLLETDTGRLGSGSAAAQTSGPFSDASLQNSFVFHSRGDTPTRLGGVNGAGIFTSDGNGNVTGGSYDAAQDGVPTLDATLTGSYSVASTGRVMITLNPTSTTQTLNPVQQIAWLVSPSRAFFLVNASGLAEDGGMDQQQGGPFSNASLTGNYSFVMFGFDTQSPIEVDRVGSMAFDGSSKVSLPNYFVNRLGSRNQTIAAGTYSVSANGRVSGSIAGVTNALVVYLSSSSAGTLVLEDSGTGVSGSIALTPNP